MTNTMKNVHLL